VFWAWRGVAAHAGSMSETPRRVQGGRTVQSRQRTSDSGH
jgi:hypothetical protein